MTIDEATVSVEIARPMSKRLGRVDDGGHGTTVEKRPGHQLTHHRREFEAMARTRAEDDDAWKACVSGHDKAVVRGVRVHANASVDHVAGHSKQVVASEIPHRPDIRILNLAVNRVGVRLAALMVHGELDAAAV